MLKIWWKSLYLDIGRMSFSLKFIETLISWSSFGLIDKNRLIHEILLFHFILKSTFVYYFEIVAP